jgi:hypothetical protein
VAVGAGAVLVIAGLGVLASNNLAHVSAVGPTSVAACIAAIAVGYRLTQAR